MKCLSTFIASTFAFAAALCPESNANAAAPTCHTHSTGGYCSYTGLAQKVYANESNWILIYFDTLLDLNAAASVGLSVTNNNACIYRIADNPDFAKMLFASALSAQARGAQINIQMRNGSSGYLKCDKIWVQP